MLRALLAAALLANACLAPLARAGQSAPTGPRGPVQPNLAAFWSGALATYFAAPKSGDPAGFAEVLAALRALDLSDAQVRASIEPVARALEACAARVLAAEKPDLARLAALTQASKVLALPEAQAARLTEVVAALSQRRREALDARMRRLALALGDAAPGDDEDPIVVLPDVPNVPLDRRVVVVYVAKEEGRRSSGKDEAAELKALVERYPGKVKLLDRDGSSYMSVAALEIAPSVREDVLRELAAIENLGNAPLGALVAAGLGRGDARRAQDLSEVKKGLKDPDLIKQLHALADLSARLQAAPADAIAAIPEAERDELIWPLLQVGWTVTTAFEMIRRAEDNVIRGRELDARPADFERSTFDHAAFEKLIEDALAAPALSARFLPAREVLIRLAATLDRLDTRDSREHVLKDLGEAQHAGFQLVASDPRLKLKYAQVWVDFVAASVAETVFGLRSGFGHEDKWSGSRRSGGYEHIEGRRQSSFLYEWRPPRARPDDMRTAAPQLLGVPGMNGRLIDLVVETLAKVQKDVGELDATNRAAHAARKLKEWESQAAPDIAKAQDEGNPIDPEVIAAMRKHALEQANEEYDRYYRVEGHGIVDSFISSLYYAPYFARTVPGYEEATYVGSVLTVFQQALERVDELGMVKQLADAALSFLSNVKDEKILGERPDLRAQAGDLWAMVKQAAAARGFALITKLDGVLDERPEINPAAPKLFEQDADGYATVWQIAESADGKYVARAGGDRVVKVWERATGKLVKKITLEDARQHYGDLDNSLGVTFNGKGRLIVATLHDDANESGRSAFQKVRVYDMADPKAELLPGDEIYDVDLPGVHVLREMPETPAGMLAIAETRRYSKDRSFDRWSGSDIRIFSLGGAELGKIDDYMLLGAQGTSVLGARVVWQDPGLGVFDVSDPRSPKDVTPQWLKQWAQDWSGRRERSEYGYWPYLSARLGTANGKPAILIADESRLQVFDLATGSLAREVEIPNGWRVTAYATDATGTKVAALVQAPGRLHPAPQRVMVWDLAAGELLIERKTENKGQLIFTRDGKELLTAGTGRTELVALP